MSRSRKVKEFLEVFGIIATIAGVVWGIGISWVEKDKKISCVASVQNTYQPVNKSQVNDTQLVT